MQAIQLGRSVLDVSLVVELKMLNGLLNIQDHQELEQVHPMCARLKFFNGSSVDEKVVITLWQALP